MISRFLTGFFKNEEAPLKPGLVQHIDGTVWLVDADGNETQITGGGGGSQNLDQVLVQGNSANGSPIKDLGSAIDPNDAVKLSQTSLEAVLAQGNSAGGSLVHDVADPVDPQDAATRAYVDEVGVVTFTAFASVQEHDVVFVYENAGEVYVDRAQGPSVAIVGVALNDAAPDEDVRVRIAGVATGRLAPGLGGFVQAGLRLRSATDPFGDWGAFTGTVEGTTINDFFALSMSHGVPDQFAVLGVEWDSLATSFMRATHPGDDGNDVTFQTVDPGLPDQLLSITEVGTAVTAHLATDGAGVITTLASELASALNGHDPRLLVVLSTSSDAVVNALPDPLPFTGGQTSPDNTIQMLLGPPQVPLP